MINYARKIIEQEVQLWGSLACASRVKHSTASRQGNKVGNKCCFHSLNDAANLNYFTRENIFIRGTRCDVPHNY